MNIDRWHMILVASVVGCVLAGVSSAGDSGKEAAEAKAENLEAVAQQPGAFLSHPPMRPLPRASSRPLADGPHRFVAPGGSDQATGSVTEPWRSIGYAVSRLVPGETLVLRGGTYYERLYVELEATQDQPITIRSYPNELAVIDGGFSEFFDAPESAWEPVTGGASGHFRSVREYPNLGRAQGLFGDSMVPLHSYTWPGDLLSNESEWSGRTEPLYCGPGLWYNPRTRRIHARLAHDRADHFPSERRYRGVTDPRKLPLVVTGTGRLPVRVRESSHLVIQDLVIRGAGSSAIEITNSHDVRLEGVTVFSGFHGLWLEKTKAIQVIDSRFRGPSAPWSSRMSLKYKGTAGVLLRTAGALEKNIDLEIAWSEFTDGHDGVFLGDTRNTDFHHNLVENFNDDGIFLTARGAPNGPIRVFQNRISRCLSSLVFGWGRGQKNLTGSGVSFYRNVVEHLDQVYYLLPFAGQEPSIDYGNLVRDHGGPTWEPMKIYQNTFVAQKAERWRWQYLLGLGTHISTTTRDVFNNIFVHVEDVPSLAVPAANALYRSNGNLLWSQALPERTTEDFFSAFRASSAFESSRSVYAPGWESQSVYGDPAFVGFHPTEVTPPTETNDYRLGPGSPALDAGMELPEEWPDPLRELDSGEPDIGALPLGVKALRVGPRPVFSEP